MTSEIVDAIGALLVVLDTEGRIVRFNKACEKLTGYMAAEVIGKSLWDLAIIDSEMDRVKSVFTELRSGHYPNQHRNFWRTRYGRLHLIDWTNTAIVGEDGSVEYVVGTGIDVTENMAAEDKLQQSLVEARRDNEVTSRSEQRFRSVVETATDAIICADSGGIVTFWNEGATRIFGYTSQEIVGQSAAVLLPAASQPAYRAALRRFASVGEIMPPGRMIEIRGVSRDGTLIPLEFSVTSWQTDDGVFFTGICRDISQRKQDEQRQLHLTALMEDARRQAENLAGTLIRERDVLQAIMESTSTMIAYLDRDFNFVLANSAYIRASGHSKEELIGRHHFDLFPNEENQAIFRKVRDTGQAVEFHAKPFTYADQPERGVTYWDWTLGPVWDAQGNIQGLVFSLLDVTEDIRHTEERQKLLRDMATQQAVTAERERLSRELHDGIAQTLGYVRFRLRSVRDLHDAGRHVEVRQGLLELEEASRSINSDLRESILGLRATSAVDDVGLVASLKDYLDHFERLFSISTDVIIETDAPTEFAPLTEVQLLAMLQEAMINIRRHAQTRHALIRFSRSAQEAIIAVVDKGKGFDLDAVPSGHYGLAIMRERAKLINANLQILSEPTLGTTVIIRVPLGNQA